VTTLRCGLITRPPSVIESEAPQAEVKQRLLAFQHRYQQTAVPFDWRYSRTDLNALLRRLAKKDGLATAA
jgi:hypothetical protein